MWGIVMIANSVLFSLSGVNLVYSIGMALLVGAWKQLLIALLVCIFFGFTQIAVAAIAEP